MFLSCKSRQNDHDQTISRLSRIIDNKEVKLSCCLEDTNNGRQPRYVDFYPSSLECKLHDLRCFQHDIDLRSSDYVKEFSE